MLKVQRSFSYLLHRITWEASKNIQKKHKSKFLCSSWIQGMEKWFGIWDATHFFYDALIDSFVSKGFLQHLCTTTWGKCEGSSFTHYTPYVSPNYKTIFFAEWETTHIVICLGVDNMNSPIFIIMICLIDQFWPLVDSNISFILSLTILALTRR